MKNLATTFLTFLFAAAASLVLQAQPANYEISITEPNQKMVHVTANFILKDHTFHMTPNGPMPERWPEYVRNIQLRDKQGNILPITKKGAQWLTEASLGQPVSLSYNVAITHDQREWPGGIDGVAFATDWGFFLTGRALFIMNGQKRSKISVKFEVPENWTVSTPWKTGDTKYHYATDSYQNLTESLIMAGQHKQLSVSRGDLELQFVLGGKGIIRQKERISSLAQQTMDYYASLMTGLPVPSEGDLSKTMVVINEANQVDGEVIGSHISMLLDPQAPAQQQMVGWFMFAHEFFHLWNGKTITVEGTREDWFKEGVTNYYTLKALHQVGFINEQALLGVLNGLFYQRYQADSGLGELSMRDAASGFDKDNHWGLVYGGGLFAGIAIDMMIREQTSNQKSLDDIMRQLYHKHAGHDATYSTNDILAAANELSGADLSSFFETYINGSKPIPIEKYLTKAGYSVTMKDGQLLVEPEAQMTKIEKQIHEGFLGK